MENFVTFLEAATRILIVLISAIMILFIFAGAISIIYNSFEEDLKDMMKWFVRIVAIIGISVLLLRENWIYLVSLVLLLLAVDGATKTILTIWRQNK